MSLGSSAIFQKIRIWRCRVLVLDPQAAGRAFFAGNYASAIEASSRRNGCCGLRHPTIEMAEYVFYGALVPRRILRTPRQRTSSST